ncbi:MAG: nucleotidyltransferase domain-containing protein [Anaerolineae bacterium]
MGNNTSDQNEKLFEADREKLAEIARKYDLDLVVLFGSRVKGRAVPGSDVDLAVRFVKRDWGNVDLELDLIGELNQAVGGQGEIDVAFLNGASPLLLFEVACSGDPLYQREPDTFTLFKSYAALRYYDHNKFFDLEDKYLKERYG